MKFKNYLLAEEAKFSIKKFYSICAPFIDKLDGLPAARLPKHGSRYDIGADWDTLEVQPRAWPRDTPLELHRLADEFFKQRFNGWAARTHSIFISGSDGQAREYGIPYLCFPVGPNFKTLWSPDIQDLFHVYDDVFRASTKPKKNRHERALAVAEQRLSEVTWHYNKRLREGLEAGVEIHLHADTVYLITPNTATHDLVLDMLGDRGVRF